MARKMAVVPTSWLDNMKKGYSEQNMPVVNEVKIFDDSVKEKTDIIALFPKNLRNKAKLMLEHLKSLNLDNNNRVIYPNNKVGSNIFDLVKYFVSDVNFSPPRPLDSEQFEKLLSNVPTSAFGRGRNTSTIKASAWKKLY